MPNVPVSSREVATSIEATPYKKVNLNGDMFGQNVYEAAQKLNNAGFDFREKMIEIKNRIDDTKLMEAKNLSSKWVQDNLMDKENGYFYKTGKDAYGKSEGLLNDYDKVMNDFIEKANLTPRNKELAKMSLDKIREPIMNQMFSHDYKSGVEWSNNVANDTLNNYLTDAVNSRNDPEMINNSIANGLKIIEWQGSLQHLDDEAVNALKKNYVQNLLGNVLNTKLGEGSLDASEFFEKYKNDLDPQKLPNFVARVKDNELNYTARETAQYLMTLPVEQANNEIEKIQDYQTRDAVEKNLTHLRSLKRQEQSDIYNEFVNRAVEKYKNNGEITENDIPQGLEGEYYFRALSQIGHLNKTGDTETDDATKTSLNYMANYDAQRFKNLDLSLYRVSLSDKDFNELKKRQEQIASGNFYTILQDNKSTKNYIEQITGVTKDHAKIFGEYQELLRNFEERKGAKASGIEKEQLLKTLGYNKDGYKQIEKAIKNNGEFYQKLVNNISYYQSRHNGEMPDSETVNKWVRELGVEQAKNNYEEIKNTALRNTKPKSNEQITLTNFADNYVPSLSKSLGVNLKVTDRYRPANGKYKSHHSEGRALDISYRTTDNKTLNVNQKIQLIENIIQRPDVEKIAISSADSDGQQIIKAVMKKYGKKYGYKIQDTNREGIDKKLGTDHTNHVHITLKKDNAIDVVTIKNMLLSHGFSQQQANNYLKSRGLI